MTSAMTPMPGASGRAHAIILGGVVVLLASIVLRCVVPMDPAPFWSGDPLLTEAPVLGLTPARSLLLDAVQALAACVIVAWGWRLLATGCGPMGGLFGRDGIAWVIVAAGVGVAPVFVAHHADARGPEAIENAWMGVSWVGGFACAFALHVACACVPRVRGLVAGVLLGIVAALAVKCVAQVYIEHPQTVATFRLTKERFFASQGWTPDSAMARAFVRRLEQPEATAWFGLANPVSTLAAGAMAACAGMLLGALPRGHGRREERRAWPAVAPAVALAVGCAACAATLVLAGSKGGYAVAMVGMGVLVLAWVLRDRPGVARVASLAIGPAVVAGVLLAVAVRGVVGERWAELSVLFRWMYLEASARIFAEALPWGTGPASFKDAYMLAKNPLSPEEIASPHSVLFDLACTLGVAGVLLGAAWLVWAWMAGRGVASCAEAPAGEVFDGRDVKLVGVTFALPTALAGLWEAQAASIGNLIVRLGGLLLAVLVASGVWRLMLGGGSASRWCGWGLCAGAMGIVAHLQIELTGVTPGAAQWALAMLAIAAVGTTGDSSSNASGEATLSRRGGAIAGIGCAVAALGLVVLAGIAGWCGWKQARWERALAGAYDACEPAREFQRRAGEARLSVAATDALVADLATAVGARPPARDREQFIDTAIGQVLSRSAREALERLDQVAGEGLPSGARSATAVARPTTLHVLRARHRLALVMAQHAPDEAVFGSSMDRAHAITREHEVRFAQRSAYWSWRGTAATTHRELLRVRGGAFGEGVDAVQMDALAAEAADMYAKATALAPHELFNWVKLAEAAQGTERGALAAERALAVSQNLRLDPLEQLRPEEEARLRRQVEESRGKR